MEVQFINRTETMEYINAFFRKNNIKVLNLDFHIEIRANERTGDHNVYTNIYTLHLPSALSYNDVVNSLSTYANIQVVRVTNT